MLQTRCWFAMVVVTIGCPGISLAATLHVPGDLATIQACIAAAVAGDECVVAPGTYHETINFLGKAITLRSSSGRDVTTIDATGLGGSVVTCASGEGPDTILDGFSITGGTGTYASDPVPAYYGGGMFNVNSSPMVTNCTFNNNDTFRLPVKPSGFGGGMYNEYSNPTVTNCEFNGNSADYGSGMHNRNSNPTVTNCTFSGNAAYSSGGGMYNRNSNPTVTNSTFSGNKASNVGGGGMLNDLSSPTVTDCTFSGNTAGEVGGGMRNATSSPTLNNCTFSGNTAGLGGGAMYNQRNSPKVINCVLWGDSPDEIVNGFEVEPAVSFSDVQGGLPVGAIDGGGNIDLDPMLVRLPDPGPDGTWYGSDNDYGDLRLQGGSPCINAGDPGFVPQPGETDLEGHARVLCGWVDMGAYEFGIGDYDCDQTVDLTDFAAWNTCMSGPLDSAAFHSTIDIRHSTIDNRLRTVRL